jgi:hypothetical protein
MLLAAVLSKNFTLEIPSTGNMERSIAVLQRKIGESANAPSRRVPAAAATVRFTQITSHTASAFRMGALKAIFRIGMRAVEQRLSCCFQITIEKRQGIFLDNLCRPMRSNPAGSVKFPQRR